MKNSLPKQDLVADMRKSELKQISLLLTITVFSVILMIAFVRLHSSNVEIYNVSNNITVTAEKYIENKININSASQSDLQTISGIGEVLSKRIVDYRNENGNFESVFDLVYVEGISETLLDKIKPYITA